MNGKTVKLLRRLARAEGQTLRSIKGNYVGMNRNDRTGVKQAIKQRTGK